MPQVSIPADIAARLDCHPAAEAHGRSYAVAVLLADALGIDRPLTPDARREAAGREAAAKRWSKQRE